jgi:hypothetical protein
MQPQVATSVPLWPEAHFMTQSIHLHDQAHGRAVEIDDIISDRMLSSKLKPPWALAELKP